MWRCPKCGKEQDNKYDICINCNFKRPPKRNKMGFFLANKSIMILLLLILSICGSLVYFNGNKIVVTEPPNSQLVPPVNQKPKASTESQEKFTWKDVIKSVSGQGEKK